MWAEIIDLGAYGIISRELETYAPRSTGWGHILQGSEVRGLLL